MSLLTFGCPVGRVSVAARGSAALQLLGAGALHSLVPRGAKVLLLHLSVLLVRFVLHQRAAPRDMCACMASFQVPPSPPRFRKSSTFCWYVPVAEGCQPRRCPCSLCCSMGFLDAMAAPLPCWSITACQLSVWWHRWQVTFRMLLWVTGGIKSTDEPRLDILLLL